MKNSFWPLCKYLTVSSLHHHHLGELVEMFKGSYTVACILSTMQQQI